jgi:fucose 4-O-acetylase-like acetyltransferase
MSRTAERAAGASAEIARARDPFWDAARFAAIALVVVGHAIEKESDSDLMAALYWAIYVFHMPLFAFLSGRFSSVGRERPDTYGKLLSSLVVPYVVFSVLWFVLRLVVKGDARLDLAAPYSHLWFLMALFVWRMALPLVAALRYPLTTSVVLGVVAGYMPAVGPVFDSGRIFGMLPFFVLGWVIRERGAPRWISRRNRAGMGPRIAATLVLVATVAGAYLGIDAIRQLRLREWVQMADNYADMGQPQWWAGGLRLSLLVLAVLLGAAVLVLVPRSAGRMAQWGSATMYVYMLHLFPIYLLRYSTDFFTWFDSAPRLVLLIGGAVAWSCLLATDPVRRIFRRIVEPRASWLIGPAPAARVEPRIQAS